MEQKDNNTLVLAGWSQRIINFVIAMIFISSLVGLIAHNTGVIDFRTFDPLNDQMPSKMYYITYPCTFIYYFIFEFFLGKTLGKFVSKTRVVTLEGEKPNIKAIAIKSALRIFELFLIISFLFLMPRNIGGIHDLVSKTRVIDEKDSFS